MYFCQDVTDEDVDEVEVEDTTEDVDPDEENDELESEDK